MRRIFLSLILIIAFITVKAQNHGSVKATILDSLNKQPISLVTVSILKLKDSSLIAYTVTDKNGAFTLRNLREEPSRLLISHVGYASLHINVDLKSNQVIDLGKRYLSTKILEEVTIKGERIPVIIKKDTIEFNAEAFKTRPNALVEDLLKKLPGVQVNHDGHITVNGKDISKIKVDGKDFFANDPKIATRNLDADMISKVQVYDDHENDPDHLLPDYEVKKIINLKFKQKLKKSTFGTAAASAGTQDRYDANLFFNKFNGDMQFSVKVNSNNLSNTSVFSNVGHLPPFLDFGSGVLKTNSGNVNFNDRFGKNFTINITYEFRDNATDNRSAAQRQQFIGDTTFNTNSITQQHQPTDDQHIHAKAEWTIDTVSYLHYEPDFVYGYNSSASTGSSFAYNNFVPLLNQNTSSNRGSGNSYQFQHSINYYHKLNKKGASLSITNGVNIHPENSLNFNANDLVSYVAALQSDTLRRSTKTTNTDNSENLGAVYHYPINKKLIANIAFSGSHDRNKGDLLTYDEDLKTGSYTIFLQGQSSDLIRTNWEQTVHPDLTYQFNEKTYFKAGVSAQLQQIDNHFSNTVKDLNQHFGYLLPAFEFHYDKVTLSYGEDVRQPAINDLQPITIVYSPLFTFIGNPNLKPMKVHNLQFNYFDFLSQSQIYVYLFSRLSTESNTIVRERNVSAEGAEVTTPINRNGRFTVSMNGTISKSFKKQGKWQISENTSFNAIYGHNFFDVNQQSGYQNTSAITVSEEISANWNDVFEIRPAYSINSAITRYALVNYKSSSYTTQKANLAMDLFVPKKITWSVNYTYIYNPLVAPGFQRNTNLLSLSVATRIQKEDKGEFSLTCYDVLNQGVSASHYVFENTINDTQNKVLRRYFLISYSYRFNDFKKK